MLKQSPPTPPVFSAARLHFFPKALMSGSAMSTRVFRLLQPCPLHEMGGKRAGTLGKTPCRL